MARTTTDHVDPARSAQMARVRGKDTKPELKVRRALHAAGLRFRLQARDLPGRPDIVFRSRRIAIFVHGCFWHRHRDPACKLTRAPKSRLNFWGPKFDANVARDERNQAALREQGWTVIVIWECDLAKPHIVEGLIDTVRQHVPVYD
ncbi:very short patch repair endonuclease [Xanthobacter sp. KR7-225]|uniref:very short patch repair endonuclease n=1 Tax=Xanthobacter sp. KR7-225 TaxID=3156613 RepID=UPI0032B3BCFB